MKKLIVTGIIVLSIAAACTRKGIPVISDRKTEPNYPVVDSVQFAPDAEAGKIIYQRRCSRCHGLPEVDLYTSKRWETILVLMGPRARLDKNEMRNVFAYVKLHARVE